MISISLELEYLNCLVLEKSSFTRNEFTQRRVPVKGNDFAVENAYGNSWLFVFHKKYTNNMKALLLDPRIKSKAATIVSDCAALARVENELQYEHDTIFKMIKERELIGRECKNSEPEPVRGCNRGIPHASSVMVALPDVEMPTENDELRAAYDDLLLKSRNSWNQWKGLVVKWPCSTSTGKYYALQLYREVDILAWLRDIGQVGFPAVAALARIYLSKPLSTAPQESFLI
ncbi:hypothetical protein PHPALM_30347 [Phytophthora palmivora]|uniref:HAT C-terminal dimerisation domain-containing protein n=1 Tax=Phytophthora palmivora TaxID=4796 RepID=A0A2P4X5C4_9STRA|nr:hypothetical protein PHPALM_30347 [Phytophthora palmivora]